jgi:glycosyltransferase involved in cell wall biosynthesis
MKVSIHTKTTDSAWGGGNQFLKALRGEFEKRGLYGSVHPDAVIYNSYQDLGVLIRDWIIRRQTARVYRLGPIFSLHRKGLKWWIVDVVTAICASICADVVVMQSEWSLAQMKKKGFFKRKNVHVIYNAVDPAIFYPKYSTHTDSNKIRLIYTSWSTNNNKGFEYLHYLDTHLNIEKYEMTFIGNTPIQYKNIKTCAPLESVALANQLRTHDIFISPTKDDACSNAILEALACGLPVVALESGANAELVRDGGELFTDRESLLRAIDSVAGNHSHYAQQILVETIEQISDRYLAVIRGSIT